MNIYVRTSKDGGNANKCMEHLWPDTNTKTIPSMGFGISVLTSKDGGNANKCMEHLWPDTKKPELIRACEHFNPA
ncbi:hypothetical protein TUM4261_28740 [Shewanella sp. c952]|nr:hypothetical protein TUM4261_28740 [Shewanella sp. c952]